LIGVVNDQGDEKERARDRERCDTTLSRDGKAQAPDGRFGVATAECQAGERAENKRGNLSERTRCDDNNDDRGQRHCSARAIRGKGLRHAPDGLRDHGDRDKLEPVQETLGEAAGEGRAAQAEGKQDKSRRRA
jgi:hypothetical protein